MIALAAIGIGVTAHRADVASAEAWIEGEGIGTIERRARHGLAGDGGDLHHVRPDDLLFFRDGSQQAAALEPVDPAG